MPSIDKLKGRRLGDGVTWTIIISAKFINLLTILGKWFHSVIRPS